MISEPFIHESHHEKKVKMKTMFAGHKYTHFKKDLKMASNKATISVNWMFY